MWGSWLPSVLWFWPLLVPQLLSLQGLLMPSACWCPFHCEVSFPASSDRCLNCLLQSFDLAKDNRRNIMVGSEIDSHRGFLKKKVDQFLWQQTSTSEQSCSTGRLLLASSTPPKLFLRQLVHNGTFSLYTLYMIAALHTPRMSTWYCVEWNFVSHFIGGKETGIATYLFS